MIPNIGPLEIAIVLVIALIVFGPKRLPSLGRSVGQGITEFREGLGSPAGEREDAADQESLVAAPKIESAQRADRESVTGA